MHVNIYIYTHTYLHTYTFSFFGAKPTSNTGVKVRNHDNHDSHPPPACFMISLCS